MARAAASGRVAVSGRAATSGRSTVPVTENLLANGVDTDVVSTWGRINVASAPSPTIAAPDGTNTARALIGTGGTALHRVIATHVTVPAPGAPIISRGYLRSGSDRWMRVTLNGIGSSANFDLLLGAVGVTSLTISQSIEDAGLRDYPALGIGSGWWRYTLVAFATTTATSGQFWTVSSDGASTSPSDGATPNGYVWGVQVARSNRDVPISHTTGTALVAAAPGLRVTP